MWLCLITWVMAVFVTVIPIEILVDMSRSKESKSEKVKIDG